jgi:sulfide:quinone oxidoreductase
MHDHLTRNGLRDRSEITLVMPMPAPIPPSPPASQALLGAFAERGIAWVPETQVVGLEPGAGEAKLADGNALPYDLFLGVPKHTAPPVVVDAGLTVDGWIPVDPLTLQTSFPDVYAIGDVTSVGTPKAGVFAEGQAAVVADAIAARVRGDGDSSQYGGRGQCYVEFGEGLVARVNVQFLSGQAPTGDFHDPSEVFTAEKADFGTSRIQRWFDRDWSAF